MGKNSHSQTSDILNHHYSVIPEELASGKTHPAHTHACWHVGTVQEHFYAFMWI